MRRREALVMMWAVSIAGPKVFSSTQESKDEEGFVRLFNGKDLMGFVPFLDPKAVGADPNKTWKVENGVIICSGIPHGYLRTEKIFENFVLRFDYRMVGAGNSGVFLMEMPDQIWPKGIEFQLLHSEVGRIFGVSGGKVEGGQVLQKPARLGEWNSYEIVNHNGFVATAINGHIVAIGCNAEPKEGHLIFQSEGVEIHLKNIRIRKLP